LQQEAPISIKREGFNNAKTIIEAKPLIEELGSSL
jgi:hypothetical protein